MRARADKARADNARADRALEDSSNARDDRSSALAERARDDLSRARADNARELSALAETGRSSSNAADMTSSHVFFDTLMTDFSPTQDYCAPPGNRWHEETVPKFTALGKENFTKNFNGKLTVTVKTY